MGDLVKKHQIGNLVGKKQNQKIFLGIIGGIGFAYLFSTFLSGKIEKILAGLSYEFSKIKVKIVGVKLVVTGTLTVKNRNPIGGTVNSFEGKIKYGKNGQEILPVNLAGFSLPPKGSASSTFTSEIQLGQLGANILSLVTSIISGNLKKLWLTGTLRTSFISIPVDDEISVFSE